MCGSKLKDLAEVARLKDYSAVALAVKRYMPTARSSRASWALGVSKVYQPERSRYSP